MFLRWAPRCCLISYVYRLVLTLAPTFAYFLLVWNLQLCYHCCALQHLKDRVHCRYVAARSSARSRSSWPGWVATGVPAFPPVDSIMGSRRPLEQRVVAIIRRLRRQLKLPVTQIARATSRNKSTIYKERGGWGPRGLGAERGGGEEVRTQIQIPESYHDLLKINS